MSGKRGISRFVVCVTFAAIDHLQVSSFGKPF